ncbi:MAG: hypothetical protein KGL61_19210, partial [Burkholderiales bacterium]|nr:hypothetical protein [Burkholderiales bacterium]
FDARSRGANLGRSSFYEAVANELCRVSSRRHRTTAGTQYSALTHVDTSPSRTWRNLTLVFSGLIHGHTCAA